MKKYLLTAVIPIFMFILGVGLTLAEVYQIEGNFFTVGVAIPKSQIQFPATQLQAGEIVRGTFIAKYNNLGTITTRFTTHFRINVDTLIFRLKNQDDPDWYYENIYKTDQFQPNQLFPFGFPPIKDSQGKTYIFEIESMAGTVGDAVSINPQLPVAQASYSFDKRHLLSGIGRSPEGKRRVDSVAIKDLLIFIFQKTYAIVVLNQYTTTFLLYLSPLPIYVFWYWIISKHAPMAIKFFSNNKVLLLTPLILFFMRAFIIKSNTNLMSILVVFSWLAGIIIYKKYGTPEAGAFILRHSSISLIVPVLIVVKAIFIKSNPDFMTLLIILLWLTAIVFYKFKNRLNIYMSLIFLILAATFNTLNFPYLAEQMAPWIIVFFGFAVFSDLYSAIINKNFLKSDLN